MWVMMDDDDWPAAMRLMRMMTRTIVVECRNYGPEKETDSLSTMPRLEIEMRTLPM
jgi:hypothetical protein